MALTEAQREQRAAPRPGRRVDIDPAKLTAARERAMLSRSELAEKAGVSKSLVYAIEDGKSGGSAATCRKLARALRVPAAQLLAQHPAPPAGAGGEAG